LVGIAFASYSSISDDVKLFFLILDADISPNNELESLLAIELLAFSIRLVLFSFYYLNIATKRSPEEACFF